MPQEPETVALVTFAPGGDHVYYRRPNHHTESMGYGTPDRPHAADFTGKADVVVPDGTPVVDKTAEACDIMFVVRGPMLDPGLEDNAVDRCPKPSAIFAGAVASNAYGALLQRHEAHQAVSKAPGPLDSVSVAAYVQLWREHGARIGAYHNRVIVWEGDEAGPTMKTDPIRRAAERITGTSEGIGAVTAWVVLDAETIIREELADVVTMLHGLVDDVSELPGGEAVGLSVVEVLSQLQGGCP